jgi:hypothetical protein
MLDPKFLNVARVFYYSAGYALYRARAFLMLDPKFHKVARAFYNSAGYAFT